MCGSPFRLTDFLDHPEIHPRGMSFVGDDLTDNRYFFNHVGLECDTLFSVPVSAFLPLVNEPIQSDVLAGSAQCEHHCVEIDDLSECTQECAYAPFRRLLLRMLDRPDRHSKAS